MTTTGPRSQKPWQPVLITSAVPSSPCFRISSIKANRTSSPPQARQPVPPHTVTQVLFGSFSLRMASRRAVKSLSDFSFNSLPPSNILFQYFFNLCRRQLAVVILIDQEHRRKGTGSQTSHRFKGKFEIRCSLALSNAQGLLDSLENILASSHVTGRSPADPHCIAAPGGSLKLGIESNHPEDAAQRDMQTFRDGRQDFL